MREVVKNGRKIGNRLLFSSSRKKERGRRKLHQWKVGKEHITRGMRSQELAQGSKALSRSAMGMKKRKRREN